MSEGINLQITGKGLHLIPGTWFKSNLNSDRRNKNNTNKKKNPSEQFYLNIL